MGWPNEGALGRATQAVEGAVIVAAPGLERECAEIALEAAGLPELVGSTDTAKIYGVESSNLSRVSGLPDPLYGPSLDPPRYVRAGNLYDADEVRAHAASRKAAA